MAKGKLKKKPEYTSSVSGVAQASQKEMTLQEECFSLIAALTLVVAVCVVPLTAEISPCKYLFVETNLTAAQGFASKLAIARNLR